MKFRLKKILSALGGRLARNVYFCLYLFLSALTEQNEAWTRGIMVLLYVQMLALGYFNNLLLVPRLLAKKRYLSYFTTLFAATFIISLGCVYSLKLMLHTSVAASSGQFNVVSGPPITTNLSLKSSVTQLSAMFGNLLGFTLCFTVAWYIMDYQKQQKAAEQARKRHLGAELLLLKSQQKAEEAKKKQTETELLFLKGQIHPHFLFNTLNNLYGLALQKSDRAPEALLKLSSILRYLLYESNCEATSFAREKEIMQAYIELELLRLPTRDNMKFVIEADTSYNIPPLLWLPVLENLFKHGARQADGKSPIDYSFVIRQGQLTISSKNIARRDAGEDGADVRGIGLNNLRQRLDILFPDKYSLSTSDDGWYYTTNVIADLNKDYESTDSR
jgi:sensor histidine kinase YesM